MKLTRIAAIAATGIALSGCASIIAGTTEDITVNTPPTTGASCTLGNDLGNWSVVSPGSTRVARSGHNLHAQCSKPGFMDGQASLGAGVEPWTFGNILIGGVIGVLIDWATGAIHKYPHNLDVPMQPAAPPPPPPSGAPGSPPTS